KRADPESAIEGPIHPDRTLFMGGSFADPREAALSVGNGTPHVPHSHTGFRVALVGDLETKTAAAQPFVVLARGGKGERPRATPKDAVDAARSGDTIEIRGDGPFLVPPLVLRKKALTIRAAAGRRPVLRLNEEGLKAERSILIESDAALVLEGLELQRIAGP